MISALLFDFDGTLAPTLPVWVEAYKNVLVEYFPRITTVEIMQGYFGRGGEALTFLNNDERINYWELVNRNVMDGLAQVNLFGGVAELLQSFNRIPKGVVTNSRRSVVEPFLQRVGILDQFSVVIGAEDVAKLKPDPQLINGALTHLQVTAADVFYLGDSESDLLAGLAAQVQPVLFSPEENTEFHDFSKLRKLLVDRNDEVSSFAEYAQYLEEKVDKKV